MDFFVAVLMRYRQPVLIKIFLVVQILFWSLVAVCFGETGTVERMDNLLDQHLFHHKILDQDGKFHLRWGLGNGKDIVFMVEVETLGYVALGLSPNGGMSGSDIVTGWVKDGEVYFQDRYAEGYWMPRIDASQDWLLIRGMENDTHTIIVFKRNLETCDIDDITVDSITSRLIYAYSEEDPPDVNNVPFHFSNRGTVSVMLLQPEIKNNLHLEDTEIWNVLSPNHTIRSSEPSIIWCKIVKIPDLNQKNHVVVIEPSIQKGNEKYVHHMTFFSCNGGEAEAYEEQLKLDGHECPHPDMPAVMLNCNGIYTSWSMGREIVVLPEQVGLPLDSSFAQYYMLQVHYNNPYRHDGIRDQSGYKLHYTSKLRPYDAAILRIGIRTESFNVIPPGLPSYVITSHSNSDCLETFMPTDGIKILAVTLHAHAIGKHIKARHFRNGTELRPIADDPHFDYNFQDFLFLPEEIAFLPDDQLTLECSFDSRQRNKTTFINNGTEDEMCIIHLLYYPRIEVSKIYSAPPEPLVTKLIGGDTMSQLVNKSSNIKLMEYMDNFDWNEIDIPWLEQDLMFSDQISYCFLGNGKRIPVKSLVSYPKDFKKYIEVPPCEDEIVASGSSENTRISNAIFFNILQIVLLITIFVQK